MLGLALKLLSWNLVRSKGRSLIMVVTVVCALSSYVLLGTALNEMAERVAQSSRDDWPFDIAAEGSFSDDQLESARQLAGVTHAELVSVYDAFLGSDLQRFITIPEDDTALIFEFTTGGLPEQAHELTVPELLADAHGLALGDQVQVIGQRPGDLPQDYQVAGILSGKAGVVTKPILTAGGMQRLTGNLTLKKELLLQADGKVSLDSLVKKLSTMMPSAIITTAAEEYEQAQESRSMSDSLVAGLRGLILAITALSLAVLFYVAQREGAYQTGVLRAIGVQRGWLLVPSLALTVVIFCVGIPLTTLLLPPLAARFGLVSDSSTIVQTLRLDLPAYVVIGLLSTIAVNWQFLSTPVPRLLKDSW